MILCDTGPLIALIDPRDPDHSRCKALFPSLRAPLMTTWMCVTEVMHFLGNGGGWAFQDEFWKLKDGRVVSINDLTQQQVGRVKQLMEKYQNLPMDIADASLVALAEPTRIRRVFTLDAHFRIYRTASGEAFEVVP